MPREGVVRVTTEGADVTEPTDTRNGRRLRVLTCWSNKPPNHDAHTHQIKDERYWCPGYPSNLGRLRRHP
jgi:hypothetical protein